MNTTENNRLIAEFMGVVPRLESPDIYWYSDGPFYSIRGSIDEVADGISKYAKYHTSWNWLMPVIEKIQETHIIEYHTYNGARVYEKNPFRPEILSITSIPNPRASNPPTKENPRFILEFDNMLDMFYNLAVRFIKLQKP